MSEKKYYLRVWVPVETEEDEMMTMEDAKKELKHCRELQPENRYEIVDTEGEIVELENKVPDFLDSKSAVVVMLGSNSGITWWFKLDSGKVLTIDHLPFNYPNMEIGIFSTVEEAIKRKEWMVEFEGWEVEKDRLEEN